MIFGCRHLSLTLPQQTSPIFHDVSLQVESRRLIALKGANGSGKTTLCQLFCEAYSGLENGLAPSWLDLEPATSPPLIQDRPLFGAIFENPDTQLFMSTVEDELAFALENLGLSARIIQSKVKQALDEHRLSHLAKQNPHQCSGGEKQRIVFAAMHLLNPCFLFIDEGFSQMDDLAVDALTETLQTLLSSNTGLLVVDHRHRFDEHADRTLWLQDGTIHEEAAHGPEA